MATKQPNVFDVDSSMLCKNGTARYDFKSVFKLNKDTMRILMRIEDSEIYASARIEIFNKQLSTWNCIDYFQSNQIEIVKTLNSINIYDKNFNQVSLSYIQKDVNNLIKSASFILNEV